MSRLRTLRVDFADEPPAHSIRLLILITLILFLFVASCQDETTESGHLLEADHATSASGAPAQDTSASGAESRSPARPKRIILISLDTVGARNVAGYSDGPTPQLEKIGRDGVRFERFYSASTYTLPSHMSMFTGLDPIEHGVVNLPSRLAPGIPTLASELQRTGYDTKAIVEGGFVKKNYGFDRGFADFKVLNERKALTKTGIWSVLDWMRTKKDDAYFLFLHTYVAHAPYAGFDDFRNRHPELSLPDDAEILRLKKKHNLAIRYPAPADTPPELRYMCTFYNINSPGDDSWLGCGDRAIQKTFNQSKYFDDYRQGLLEGHREGIRRGDRMVGQIRDTLIELGQLEDTLLIVTSDHGEGVFEHSIHGHDYLPFDEVVKVPLFVSYPRRIEGGQVIEGLSWHLDLLPTILSLANVEFDRALLGEDLTPMMLGNESIASDRAIFPVLLRPPKKAPLPMRRMAIKGDYKFIEGNRHYGDSEGLLFDVQNSPDENENLRATKPELFEEMQALALDYDGALTPGSPVHQETLEPISPFPGDVEPFQLSPEDEKELEALGYIFDDPNGLEVDD